MNPEFDRNVTIRPLDLRFFSFRPFPRFRNDSTKKRSRDREQARGNAETCSIGGNSRSCWRSRREDEKRLDRRAVSRRALRARASPAGSERGARERSHVPFPFSTVYRYVRYNGALAPAVPTCCCPAPVALTRWRHAVSNSRPPATDNSTCLKGET